MEDIEIETKKQVPGNCEHINDKLEKRVFESVFLTFILFQNVAPIPSRYYKKNTNRLFYEHPQSRKNRRGLFFLL